MIIMGILLILICCYASIYLAKLDIVQHSLSFLPPFVPTEFVINSIAFVFVYILYAFFEKAKYRSLFDDIEKINVALNQFISDKKIEVPELYTSFLRTTLHLITKIEQDYQKYVQKVNSKIEILENDIEALETILNLEDVLVCEVTESGKVKKANKQFLKFFGYKNEVKLNMQVKNIQELFGDEFGGVYLNEILHQEKKIKINNREFLLRVEKVQKEESYIISLIDITNFEEEKKEIEKKALFSGSLKSEKAINKTFETTMIRIINYENYAEHLGLAILEVFEEAFVAKIKSLGYDEIFKIQNDIFAIYDLKVDYERYKKVLEETIKIVVAGDTYIFNPKVVLASGVNFDQAYQQILESTKTFVSKEKNDVKYHPEIIRLLNKSIDNNNIALGYKVIDGQNNTIVITPVIEDEYGAELGDKIILDLAREFNLYLMLVKELLLNNLNILKNHKIIIDVTSEELLSTTILADLLSLIRREDLFVIFNVDINSNYSVVFPILKQIKSFAQLSIKNVGRGYISFRDVYALKVEYLEVDDSIIQLIQTNPQWKFLLDSVKILVSAQKTKLLANNYKDDRVLRISSELKVYKN